MSAARTIFSLVAGIASGLALAYYADPKGSKKKIRQIEKDLGKTRKQFDKKMKGYKKEYNGVIGKSQELINGAKSLVSN